jgi:hypothetical protein
MMIPAQKKSAGRRLLRLHFSENRFRTHRITCEHISSQAQYKRVPVLKVHRTILLQGVAPSGQASGRAVGARSAALLPAVQLTRRTPARRLGDRPDMREGASHEDYTG